MLLGGLFSFRCYLDDHPRARGEDKSPALLDESIVFQDPEILVERALRSLHGKEQFREGGPPESEEGRHYSHSGRDRKRSRQTCIRNQVLLFLSHPAVALSRFRRQPVQTPWVRRRAISFHRIQREVTREPRSTPELPEGWPRRRSG